ncbi:hypothetical protein SteCoe_31059 [Stentor coeruleus]|uniref:Uncharacterized protein n=1 Tax=Stentor coeruleus TaxID=5963 RepID=A0A1R2B256_9CILI|nr:hypothetical protein SteCoe_31059 [Stentor coeruleus]
MEKAYRRDYYSLGASKASNERISRLDSEEDCLNLEIDSLRRELENVSRQNSLSLLELKSYQEQQLSKLFSDKESILQAEFDTILSLQKYLSKESDECSRLRQTILNYKMEHSERFSDMNIELERLVKEADYLRNQLIRNCKEEARQYQNKVETKRLDYSKKIRNIENYKHGELYDAENALEKEEIKIKKLEFELQDLRMKVLEKNNFSEGELEKIHTSLRSTQRVAEKQELDLKTLRVERDKARNEARDQEKNMNITKRRMESLRDENNALKQQLKRVERLKYGIN